MDLLKSLESSGLDLRKQKKPGEYLAVCPHCQKLKLAINVEKGKWQCWHCGQGGGVQALSKWVGVKINYGQDQNFLNLRHKFLDVKPLENFNFNDTDKVLPCEFIPLTKHSHLSIIGQRARAYLYGRGLADADIAKWGLGYCSTGKFRNMIIVPVEDTDGNIRTFQTRRFQGVGPKNLNPYSVDKFVYNLRHAYGFPGLVVVEGPWDAQGTHRTLASEFNISSAALLGHTCNHIQARQIAQFLKPEYTWIALDPDVTEMERENVASILMAEGLKNVEILHPSKDPDELLVDDFVILFRESKKPVRRRITNV